MPRANRHFLPGHVWDIIIYSSQFKSFQSFNRYAPFMTGISPFQTFQSFNRCAPFKAFQANVRSKSSKVPVVPIVPLHKPKIMGSKNLGSLTR
jgi:hypothetical protein